MSLKLNVGVMRKVGQPDYGSVGELVRPRAGVDPVCWSAISTASTPGSATPMWRSTRPSTTSWPA